MTKRISANIYGSNDVWAREFPPLLVPHILKLICEVWPICLKRYSFKLDDHEVPITRRLKYLLQQARTSRKLPVFIQRELPEEIERNGDVEEKGRIDLVFIHGYRENVYFAFECKRLNITYKGETRSLATEYVGDQGLSAFIQNWYSQGLKNAGMIGYVMDGDIKKAQEEIDKKIKLNKARLKTEDGLSRSSLLKDDAIKESVHSLSDRQMTVYHVFLSLIMPVKKQKRMQRGH